MEHRLPELPYSNDGLTPNISTETMEFHYHKHHAAYVANLNNLVKDTPFAESQLEEIIKSAEGPLFNNAAQGWNHTFYWNSLSPQGGGTPHGDIGSAITRDFGGFENFKEQFTKCAATTFGSGWAWLVLNGDNKLEIISTQNANTPLRDNLRPILNCDVWEHAYYIDYRNARPKFVEAFLTSLVNWDFAARNFA